DIETIVAAECCDVAVAERDTVNAQRVRTTQHRRRVVDADRLRGAESPMGLRRQFTGATAQIQNPGRVQRLDQSQEVEERGRALDRKALVLFWIPCAHGR